MKDCVECGKKLGIIEGYRHPTMGKEYLICNHCFDTVIASVDTWQEAVSSYVDFFHKESSTRDDLQKIGIHITKNMGKIQNKIVALWSHKTNHTPHETVTDIN